MKHVYLFLVVFVLLLVLPACEALPFTASPTSTVPPFPTRPVDALEIPATGSSCLVGEWELLDINRALLENLAAEATGQDVEVREVTGRMGVQFLPDGQLLGYVQDVNLSSRVAVNNTRLPATVTIDGAGEGTYTADDETNVLTVILTDASRVDVSARVLVVPVFNDNLQSLAGGNSIVGTSVDLEYACNGDQLDLTFERMNGEMESVRLLRVSQ